MKRIHIIQFLILLMPAMGWTQVNLDSGLVAYWPFNGNANDSSANGYHGGVFGATITSDRFEQPNNAYEFDGIDDYINFGDQPGFRFTTDYSISLWIYYPGGGTVW